MTKWFDLPVEIVKWLSGKGILTPPKCPIKKRPTAKRDLVSLTPVHPSGRPFFQDKTVGLFYIETHYSARNHVGNVQFILSHLGQDPSQFSVRF